MYSIYDGHGGEFCSEFLQSNVHKFLLRNAFKSKADLDKNIK